MRQQLSDSIADYTAFRASQDFSKGTLGNERGILTKFLTEVGNLWCHNIEGRHITRYFEAAAKTKKPSSLANDHTVLKGFFAWCRHTKRMPVDHDPMYGRRPPKPVKRERYRIHVSKFNALLDHAEERDPRDRALVAVLLYTLMRDRDAAALRVRDVDLDAGYLHVYIAKSRIEDRVPISLELDRELRKWLTCYSTVLPGGLQPHYYLLPRRHSTNIIREPGFNGRILSHDFGYEPDKPTGAGARTVAPLLEKVGVPLTDKHGEPTHEGAHTLRRSGARALFDRLVSEGYDRSLRVVQSALHHDSQATTERYIGITADRRTRDDLIRGQLMYPAAQAENVVALAPAR